MAVNQTWRAFSSMRTMSVKFPTPVVMRFWTYRLPVDEVVQRYIDAVRALPAMREWTEAAAAERELLAKYESVGSA